MVWGLEVEGLGSGAVGLYSTSKGSGFEAATTSPVSPEAPKP